MNGLFFRFLGTGLFTEPLYRFKKDLRELFLKFFADIQSYNKNDQCDEQTNEKS